MAKQTKDFRGLTIFELLTILAVVGVAILWALSSRSSLENKAYDATRKARVSIVKEHLKYYILENSSFPSMEEFNDQEKRSSIFSGLITDEGEEVFQDPKDSKLIMDYITDPEDCAPETDILCEKAALSFKLSDGQEFIKFAVKPGSEAEYLQEIIDEEQTSIPQSLTQDSQQEF